MAGMSRNKYFIPMVVFTVGTVVTTISTEAATINTPVLQSPTSGSAISDSSVTLKWFFVDFTNYYQIQIALDEACTQVIANQTGIDDAINQFVYTGLPQDGTRFYWRVRATSDDDGNCLSHACSEWSPVWSFVSATSEITPEPHPADINVDWRLVMDEIIPYVGGWQQGTNPMAYAIRGVSLWQNGEYYAFNGDLSCPLCWVLDSKNGMELKSEPDAALHNVTRSITDNSISLMVMPTSGATVWGVEEYVPSELTTTEITGSNSAWDGVNRKISWWGTGDMPVVLGYQVEGADGSYTMQGAANVDGATVDITGDSAVQLGNVSQEGETVSEGEGETVVEDEGELPVRAEGEAPVEGETSLTDEDAAAGAGCCSPQCSKDLIREYLGNWLLFALACLVLVRMGRVG